MAEDISKLKGKFSLSEEESVGVEVQEEVLEKIALKRKSCLVGKLIADRIIGKNTIISKLILGWKPTGSLSFKVLGDNLFLLDFENAWDKSLVAEGQPWVFEGNLFSVEDFDGLTPPTQMGFETSAFWVWMYNLPLAYMERDVGYKLGGTVGAMEEVDTNEDCVGWREFL